MTLDEAIIHAEEVASTNEKLCERFHPSMQSYDYSKCAEEHRQLAEWLKELKRLREQTRWIPISEEMPKEREWMGTDKFGTTISDEVYVTFEYPDGDRFTDHLIFQNGKVPPHKQREIDVFDKGVVPIAWMPLPKPYEPQESEG